MAVALERVNKAIWNNTTALVANNKALLALEARVAAVEAEGAQACA